MIHLSACPSKTTWKLSYVHKCESKIPTEISMSVVKSFALLAKLFYHLSFDRQFQFETSFIITTDQLCLDSRPLYFVV